MVIESIEVKTAGLSLAFVEFESDRYPAIQSALTKMGAIQLTQQLFAFKLNRAAALDVLRGLFGCFSQGDIISLVCEDGGILRTTIISLPKK